MSTNGLDGVDLDFEPNSWTTDDVGRVRGLRRDLAGALHTGGQGVEVDLDAYTTTPWDAVRYADVAAAGAHLVVMAYDDEYASASSPITPT